MQFEKLQDDGNFAGVKAEREITFLARWFCVVVYIGLINEQFGYPNMSFLVFIKMQHLNRFFKQKEWWNVSFPFIV